MIEIITTKPYIRHSTYHPFQTSVNLKTIERNKIITQTNNKPPKPTYTHHNKKALLKCGDIESNLGLRYTLLLNHPQIYHVRQKNILL
jgi:hypothetical protein